MPSLLASWTGPSRSRSPSLLHRFVVALRVLCGEVFGRDDRPRIDSPLAERSTHHFTVGQDAWKRAATSPDRPAVIYDQASDFEAMVRGQSGICVGHGTS